MDVRGEPRIRRPQQSDLAAVTALFQERDRAATGVVDFTEEDLGHDWAVPEFDLQRDAWAAEDSAGRLVAYGDVFPDEPGFAFVEVVTRPGEVDLEATLLRLLEERGRERAREQGPLALRVAVTEPELERARRYEAAGYRRVRTILRMRLEAGASAPTAPWPAGVEPAVFDPAADAEEVHGVLQSAFADHFAIARPVDFDRWRHDTLEHPAFDPTCWVLAREHGRLVGAVVALPEQGEGWIKTLGVRADARRRGIGAAMLAEAIRRLRARGLGAVQLGVDSENPTRAAGLYERAGMRVVRRTEIYEKRVGALGSGRGS